MKISAFDAEKPEKCEKSIKTQRTNSRKTEHTIEIRAGMIVKMYIHYLNVNV